MKLYVSRSWETSSWNQKITSLSSKNEKLAQKEYERMYSNAIWCQTTIVRGRKYTRKIVPLPFSISEKFELPGLSTRPNHTHFPLSWVLARAPRQKLQSHPKHFRQQPHTTNYRTAIENPDRGIKIIEIKIFIATVIKHKHWTTLRVRRNTQRGFTRRFSASSGCGNIPDKMNMSSCSQRVLCRLFFYKSIKFNFNLCSL